MSCRIQRQNFPQGSLLVSNSVGLIIFPISSWPHKCFMMLPLQSEAEDTYRCDCTADF